MNHPRRATVVLDVRPILRGSEKAVVEAVLGRRAGVERVEANPVSQTATVVFDVTQTSLADLRRWVEECGLHCDGQSVPNHICDPLMEPDPPDGHHHGTTVAAEAPPAGPDHHPREMVAASPGGHIGHAAPAEGALRSPHEMMGHGGHGGMSMEAMVADMRNRFVVAALFSIPILLWSPIGREVLGFELAAPFGLRDDVWSLLLSLPVIFYSCWIFFDGAVRALRARTLDMMVLVAVAVGAGWGYSVFVTLTGGGEVFYEAASVLAAFVLLGHWFELRARGGANDAIRSLLDLAPPKALVLRDGQAVEVPSAEVQVGDLLLVRPGAKIATDGVVEEGESEVDESVVTGESLPVHKQPGDEVIGATINKNGTLRVRATKVGADTALAQIVELVQEAQNSKAPGQRLADRAAFWRRPRPGHPDRDHDRHRARRPARDPVQERHRPGDGGPDRHGGAGQDRHPDQGRTRGHRGHPGRWGEQGGAVAAGGGGGAGVRAPSGRGHRPPRHPGQGRPGGR
jgi:Cu2+-exporting ATPase